ncbi:hypothetical protein [Terribacillus saccharophilus]|uniref:hypothetical protein n=1 Tax=Terribacillus saccharophilus TaxID=361277 RepID=UPI002989DAAB|nr:hypothetical protein [Terribacillus saccharophilus]MCM3227001.1 hypothetical protein [Terribacillus saccharophilus]MEC0301677.1 hypothetical protein [Terribacillus saccharophilus]
MWIKLGIIAFIIAILQLFTLQVVEQFIFISKSLYLYPVSIAVFGGFCFVMLYILKGGGS